MQVKEVRDKTRSLKLLALWNQARSAGELSLPGMAGSVWKVLVLCQ